MNIIFQENNCLFYENDGETLKIEPWGSNALRVRAVKMGELIDSDFALLKPVQQKAAVHTERFRGEISNGNIKGVIDVDPNSKKGRISFYNHQGKLLLQEVGEQGALKKHARRFKPIVGGDYRLTVSFDSDPDEKLYGMGQYQQEIINIKNCHFELAHRNSQASIPFILSSLGYGFLWHNPAIGEAGFEKNITRWHAESTKQMDYWITAGDTPSDIVESYAEVTGTVPMMPEYGLGFWQCKLRYYNQEQLLTVAREYKKRNIPIDVIVCDFFHWPKMGDFRFEEEFFPDPKAMTDELKAMGIELMVSIWPQIDLESENYEEMKQKGLLVKIETGVDVCMQFGGDSVFFDATNPKARAYVWEKCRKNYYDHGIKLFWLDEAEPEYGTYDFDNYRYFAGPNLQIGNLYPQHYSKAFYDGMKNQTQENIVNLVRCAWAGSQRYGALVWSGDIHSDYNDFRKQICAGLHMGLCGIPWWTTDIGGFYGGDPDDEGFRQLLIRWFQYGTFCPVMRLHGDRMPQSKVQRKDGSFALQSGADNELWSFGEKAYEIMKKYIELREKMRPYVRSLMEEAHEKGTPVMRTMFYEFPEDEACWELKDQYMFGADILAAPVVNENMYERSVYLPSGASWTDMHSGEVYDGGAFVQVPAPLDKMPVFLRDGSMNHLIGSI